MTAAAPELPEGLAEFVQDGRLFHRAEAAAQRVQLALYRLIAAGLPVDRDGLALAVGRDPVEVADILAAIPASNFLYDSGGQIVGFRGLGALGLRRKRDRARPVRNRAWSDVASWRVDAGRGRSTEL